MRLLGGKAIILPPAKRLRTVILERSVYVKQDVVTFVSGPVINKTAALVRRNADTVMDDIISRFAAKSTLRDHPTKLASQEKINLENRVLQPEPICVRPQQR